MPVCVSLLLSFSIVRSRPLLFSFFIRASREHNGERLDLRIFAQSFQMEKERVDPIPKGKPKSGRTWKMNKGRYIDSPPPRSATRRLL